jgi:predicted outer membrane repeat protein
VIHASVLEMNSAGYGGAIYAVDKARLILDAVRVRLNYASELGGGLYLRVATPCQISNESSVENNTAIGAAQVWFGKSDQGTTGLLTIHNSNLSLGTVSSQLWLMDYQLTGTSAIIFPQSTHLFDSSFDGNVAKLLACRPCDPGLFNFQTE